MRVAVLLPIVFAMTVQSVFAGQWIVVVAPALRPAIEPLIERRKAEGWDVTVVPAPAEGLAEVAAEISRLADRPGENCLLLVGDAGAEAGPNRVAPGLGSQLRMKEKGTDRPWSLLTGNPEHPLITGRLPARTPEEARTMVGKILAWPERAKLQGPFPEVRLMVGYHAAPVAFGGMADSLINQLTQSLVTRLPAAWRLRGFVHVNGSSWQGISEDLPAVSQEMMKASVPLLAYMGHSGPSGAASKEKVFFGNDDWRHLTSDGPQTGLFFSCGCNSCELGEKAESYGFAAMRAPGGPAAVIGSQGISYAAMGYLAISGLINSLAADPPPVRLGTLWAGTQAGLRQGEIADGVFSMLDFADGTGGAVPLAAQRLEHLESWMLLGDPAMPLFHLTPPIRLKVEKPVTSGEELVVSGELPESLAEATVRLTFERHPGTLPTDLPKVAGNEAARLAASRKRRQLAEEVVLVTKTVSATGGTFRAALALPANLPAPPWTLRALVLGKPAPAAGVLQLPAAP